MPIKLNGSSSGYTQIEAAATAGDNTLTLPTTSGTLMTTGGTNTFIANQVIEVNDNTNAALRITQLGTGNALLVEDSTNPDSTPFVVDASGKVGIGTASPSFALDVSSNTNYMTRFGGTLNNYLGIQIANASNGSSACSYLQFGNDALGYASYIGHNSSTSTQPGGANALTLYQTLNAPMVMYTNNAERMRIDGLGRIFIAGASMDWAGGGNIVMPDSSSFSFNGTTGHFVTNMYYNGVWRMNSNAAGALYVQGAGAHIWYNAPAGSAGSQAGLTERMNLAVDGTWRIGSSSAVSAPFSAFVPGSNIGYWVTNHPTGTGSGNWYHAFQLGGGTVGTIAQSGNTGVTYNTTSDYRLKENVVPLSNAAERVLALKPSRFNFKEEPDRTVDGFLAHEAQEVVPEAVTGAKDAVDEEGKPIYQGIDQSKLVPLLTAALQEALTKIDALETRIAALENA